MEGQSTESARKLPSMMTPCEVLEVLRLDHAQHPEAVLYRLRQSGRLHGVRIGRQFIYSREEVMRLLESGLA